MKDSLFNEDKSKEIGKLEATYVMEKQLEADKRTAEEAAKRSEEAQDRRNKLRYSAILILMTALFAGVSLIEKVNVSVRLAEGIIFFTFLLFFELMLVLLDPCIETYSSGAPAIKLGFNALLAAMIFPLHAFLRRG